MQRLFSTFPNSGPGTGLLCLRVTVAIPLLLQIAAPGWGGAAVLEMGLRTAAAVCGILLLLGAWTPVAGSLAAAIEVATAVLSLGPEAIHFTRAAICVALLLLGPGAWSIDARRFGRKRIDV